MAARVIRVMQYACYSLSITGATPSLQRASTGTAARATPQQKDGYTPMHHGNGNGVPRIWHV